MLPVCIVGVIIGDSFLYFIGRFWGAKLVKMPFISKRLLTPERLASISENFKTYGVKILLFARLTPGIRAPIFLTAGITKLPLAYFIMADAIYAVPGVTILFFLSYWFTDSVLELVDQVSYVKPIIVLVVLAGLGIYLLYRVWRKPMVTGDPHEMPPIVGPMTERLESVAESMADKVLHRSSHPDIKIEPPKAPPAENNGTAQTGEEMKQEHADGRQ
jgi:membrane protein DedA with SNARE-associated domain